MSKDMANKTPFENAKSLRGRLIDPLSLEELPQDQTLWIVLGSAAYSPVSVRSYVEQWEIEKGVHPDARACVASFSRWTRGYAGVWGAYTLPDPLRQGIALSTDTLRTIHNMMSNVSVRERRSNTSTNSQHTCL